MFRSSQSFRDKVNGIYDEDYGDFMRKAHAYFMEFRGELGPFLTETLKLKLAEMEMYIQFTPNWDVDSTKSRILKDIDLIDRELAKPRPSQEIYS
ncbi:MAG: hypothetical protein AB7O96_10565 [Pseudobdellovibrionaceae bacterium]